jgi:hypothetical protein
MEGIGEGLLGSRKGPRRSKKNLGGDAMKLQTKSLQEVISLAVYKASTQNQKEVVVYIPARFLPPVPPYRTTTVESEYGPAKLFCRPSSKGGWIITVRFKHSLTFNPAIPQTIGEELLKKLNK